MTLKLPSFFRSFRQENLEPLVLRVHAPYTEALDEALRKYDSVVREIKENLEQQDAHISVLMVWTLQNTILFFPIKNQYFFVQSKSIPHFRLLF
jgi:hypothetical protein